MSEQTEEVKAEEVKAEESKPEEAKVEKPKKKAAKKAAKKKVEEENLAKIDGVEEEDVPFGTHVPFGPMLAVAGLIYIIGINIYVDAYFADFVLNFLTQ